MAGAVASSPGGAMSPGMLDRARRGDHAAFAEIVRAHDAGLRALAFRLLGDRNRMDDVLQEAYLKAYLALPRFRGESSLHTWLYTITYRECVNDMRRRQARPVLPVVDHFLDGHGQNADGPEAQVVQRTRLADVLAQLPVDQRAAVLLVDELGFDYPAAAELLGVPRGTLAARLHRARNALRLALATEYAGVA